MVIFGIILLIADTGLAIYGNSMNGDLEAQLSSLLEKGSANPGDIFLYIGIGAAVLGLILLISGLVKKKN